jgi:hypothetical protein
MSNAEPTFLVLILSVSIALVQFPQPAPRVLNFHSLMFSPEGDRRSPLLGHQDLLQLGGNGGLDLKDIAGRPHLGLP